MHHRGPPTTQILSGLVSHCMIHPSWLWVTWPITFNLRSLFRNTNHHNAPNKAQHAYFVVSREKIDGMRKGESQSHITEKCIASAKSRWWCTNAWTDQQHIKERVILQQMLRTEATALDCCARDSSRNVFNLWDTRALARGLISITLATVCPAPNTNESDDHHENREGDVNRGGKRSHTGLMARISCLDWEWYICQGEKEVGRVTVRLAEF